MPFDWVMNKQNPAFVKKIAPRFGEMHRREIEQRAKLLFNLKFNRDAAVARIKAKIAWEFELSRLPKFHKEVGAIVDRVYRTSK